MRRSIYRRAISHQSTRTLEVRRITMNVQFADILVHIDDNLSAEQRLRIEDNLRAIDGVVSVHNPDDRPHLTIVQFVPNKTSSAEILKTVTGQGIRAELVGL
jgi:hypothetical protein